MFDVRPACQRFSLNQECNICRLDGGMSWRRLVDGCEAADLASQTATGAAFGRMTPTRAAHPRPAPRHSPAERPRAAVLLPSRAQGENQSPGYHCRRRHLPCPCPCPCTAALPPPPPSSSPSQCAQREHAARQAEAWPSHPSCMPRKRAMAGQHSNAYWVRGGDEVECRCKGASVGPNVRGAVQCCFCTTAAPGDGRVAGACPKPTLVRRQRQRVDTRTVLHCNAGSRAAAPQWQAAAGMRRTPPAACPADGRRQHHARSPRRPRCGGRGRRRGG